MGHFQLVGHEFETPVLTFHIVYYTVPYINTKLTLHHIFRRIHSHPLVSGWLRFDSHNERHQQEILSAILLKPGAN